MPLKVFTVRSAVRHFASSFARLYTLATKTAQSVSKQSFYPERVLATICQHQTIGNVRCLVWLCLFVEPIAAALCESWRYAGFVALGLCQVYIVGS